MKNATIKIILLLKKSDAPKGAWKHSSSKKKETLASLLSIEQKNLAQNMLKSYHINKKVKK
jgi:hypothetical protein